MNQRIFAIGDIHGCFNSFKELVEQKMQLTKSDKLILLGDYIDRGTQSKEVIDFIMELKQNKFDILPLRGNHEQMLLDALFDEDHLPIWLLNGGDETMKSFGIDSLTKLATNYVDFFSSLPLYVEFDNCLFVHAGFNDQINNPFDDTNHMIWTSRDKYKHPFLKDKTIVHGHRVIPSHACDQRIKKNDRVIDLDTGCVYTNYSSYGRLTALEINSREVFFV